MRFVKGYLWQEHAGVLEIGVSAGQTISHHIHGHRGQRIFVLLVTKLGQVDLFEGTDCYGYVLGRDGLRLHKLDHFL